MELSNASASIYKAAGASATVRPQYSKPATAYTSPYAQPFQVTLAGEIFRDYSLVQPLVVSLEQAGGKIIASDDVFYMYGEGHTRQEAVRDYLSSLAEYYELLES